MSTERTIILTDNELITGIKNGRQDHFALLYDKYAAVLLDVISRITGDPVLSEELLKSVFVTAWNEIPTHPETATPLLTRLVMIARKSALEAVNTEEKAHKNQIPEPDAGSPCASMSKEQRVLELIYYKGLSLEETGKLLNMEPEFVMASLRKAIFHFKEAAKL